MAVTYAFSIKEGLNAPSDHLNGDAQFFFAEKGIKLQLVDFSQGRGIPVQWVKREAHPHLVIKTLQNRDPDWRGTILGT